MFGFFFKRSKVKEGKAINKPDTAAAAAGGQPTASKNKRAGGLVMAFKKLNQMDRRQAYTWGAVVIVALIALFTLGSAVGSTPEDDFSDFETRGYDLANMPFSSDEAEQYLLAAKYPDMQGNNASALYSPQEKQARQEEEADEEAELDTSASSTASEYVPGRYYGGGSGGGAASGPTSVGTLNSAGLKSAGGSGLGGTYFGPTGDFSNFKNQDKGVDRFTGPGSGNARKALFQSARGSRAAAGLKNDKLLNAKKAMMGGNIKGSGAFMDDSGAVNLGEAKGLAIDPNAPVSSVDVGGMDDALEAAKETAEDEAQQAEEQAWWQEMLIDIAKQAVQGLLSMGMNTMQDAAAAAKQARAVESAANINAANQAYSDYLAQKKAFEGGETAWKEAYPNTPMPTEAPKAPYAQITSNNPDPDTFRNLAESGNKKARRKLDLDLDDNGNLVSRKTGEMVYNKETGQVGNIFDESGQLKKEYSWSGKEIAKANDALKQYYIKTDSNIQNIGAQAKANWKAQRAQQQPELATPQTQEQARRAACSKKGATGYVFGNIQYSCN